MPSRKELPSELHDAIVALCKEGDALAEAGKFKAAIKKYDAAFRLVPEPKEDWSATSWIWVARGDACIGIGNFKDAANLFQSAIVAGELGNPYVHLRLGECFFELKRMDRAADELARAYQVGGEGAFEGDDPKYLAFVREALGIGKA